MVSAAWVTALFWSLSGNSFQGFIAQYAPGRYPRCHAHEAGPVLLCLFGGKGYAITWPGEAGRHPGRAARANWSSARTTSPVASSARPPATPAELPRPLWRIKKPLACLPGRVSSASEGCAWCGLARFESRHQRGWQPHRVPRRGPANPQNVPRAVGKRRSRF